MYPAGIDVAGLSNRQGRDGASKGCSRTVAVVQAAFPHEDAGLLFSKRLLLPPG